MLATVREFVSSHPTEVVAVHVTSGEGGGDWRASVDWRACQSVILEVLRDKLIPEQMRDMPVGMIHQPCVLAKWPVRQTVLPDNYSSY